MKNQLTKPSLLSNYENYVAIAGTDEVGRGAIIGNVTAAAVILPDGFYHKDLKDSKKMTVKQKDAVDAYIREHAIAFAIGEVSAAEIDIINILQATLKAMDIAVKQLSVTPDFLLVDGNRFYPTYPIPFATIIKGDNTYAQIAAASVLAKVHRDKEMKELHKQYPQYGWDKNAGYGTAFHIDALRKHGQCPYHRRTFLKNI